MEERPVSDAFVSVVLVAGVVCTALLGRDFGPLLLLVLANLCVRALVQ